MSESTPPPAPKINWNSSQMTSTYANVCNAVGSREEVAVFFGISNPGGDIGDDGAPQVEVQLSTRVILSPFAAKRLATLLNGVVDQYEARFGALGETGPAAKS